MDHPLRWARPRLDDTQLTAALTECDEETFDKSKTLDRALRSNALFVLLLVLVLSIAVLVLVLEVT